MHFTAAHFVLWGRLLIFSLFVFSYMIWTTMWSWCVLYWTVTTLFYAILPNILYIILYIVVSLLLLF